MAYKRALYDLKQEDLDMVSGGQPLHIMHIAIVVGCTSDQTVTQTGGSELTVITHDVLRVDHAIGPH